MDVRQFAPKNLPNWRSENTIQSGFVQKNSSQNKFEVGTQKKNPKWI